MKRPDLPPLDPELSSLLASEKILLAQPDHMKARAVARARAGLSGAVSSPPAWRQPPRWSTARTALAAGIVLTVAVAGAATFQAQRSALLRQRATAPETATETALSDLHPAPVTDLASSPPASHEAVSTLKPVVRAAVGANEYAVELRLLRQARTAIARGAFADALVAIAEHARRLPSGRLAEEREALRVRSLSGLRRHTEARRAADAFKARFPRSVLLPRVDAMAQEASE
jgi:hypothetical protein